MNLLFPVSVTLATIVTALLLINVLAAPIASFERTGFMLLATLSALAVLEHWFLVVPIPFEKLWSWGLSERHHTPHQQGPIDADFHRIKQPPGPLAATAAPTKQ